MVTDIFSSLLQEVGHLLHVKLQPDVNNSCLLKIPTGLSIQMEVDKKGTDFIIGADLGPIPAGKYRENLFREALKANGMPLPRYGVFAYSKQLDHLLLIEMLPLKNLNGERIVSLLKPFGEKALTWQTAITHGEIPIVAPEGTTSSGGGIFGLKP